MRYSGCNLISVQSSNWQPLAISGFSQKKKKKNNERYVVKLKLMECSDHELIDLNFPV